MAVNSATGNPILEHSFSALDSVKSLACNKAMYQKIYASKGIVTKSLRTKMLHGHKVMC